MWFVYLSAVIFSFVATNANHCDEALKRLVDSNVITAVKLDVYPSNGSELCGGGRCCNTHVTDQLLEHSEAQLQSLLQHTTNNIRTYLHSKGAQIREAVVEDMISSQHETLEVFEASYPRLVKHVKPVLEELFNGLKDSLGHTNTGRLDETLNKYWDDMFPIVYHGAVHAKMPPFTSQYSACVREARKTIRPWGIVPALVDEPITRAVEASRLLLHAIHIADRVLQSTEGYEIAPECRTAVARMAHCGACHAVNAPPCHNFCLNVARGCLAPLAEVGSGWADWVSGVARAGRALKAGRAVFARLPDHLPDAVLVAMETGPKLQKKIKRQCGPPTHETESASDPQAHNLEGVADKSQRDRPEGWTGDVLIKDLIKDVYGWKGFWQEIPDKICPNFTRALESVEGDQCWNGVELAPYTRDVADVGISAQKYNPEVQITKADDFVYTKIDDLRAVKRLILNRITWLPETESQRHGEMPHETYGTGNTYGAGGVGTNYEGGNYYGTGNYGGRHMPDPGSGITSDRGYDSYDEDDEDAYAGEYGSGSGDGMQERESVQNTYPVYTGRNEEITGGSSSVTATHTSLVAVTLMVALIRSFTGTIFIRQ